MSIRKVMKDGKPVRGLWQVVVTVKHDKTGQQRITKRVHGSYRDAAIVEADLKAQVRKSFRPAAKINSSMTLSDFFEYYLDNHGKPNLAPRTIEKDRQMFVRVNAALGHRPLSSIQPAHILQFYEQIRSCKRLDKRQGALSQNSIHKYHLLLHKLFRKAVQWGVVFRNPVDNVDPPKYRYETNQDALSEEDLARFFTALDSAPVKWQVACLLGIGCGLRRGEIFGLKWQDFDFEANTVTIVRQNQPLPGGGQRIGDLKALSARRTVSLPSTLHHPLKTLLRASQSLTEACLSQGYTPTDFLFRQSDGQPANADSFNTWLQRFTEKHNLPRITPHTLRHCSATYLIASGIDLQTVASRLGHASPLVTSTVYSHLLRSHEQASADALDSFFAAAKKHERDDKGTKQGHNS